MRVLVYRLHSGYKKNTPNLAKNVPFAKASKRDIFAPTDYGHLTVTNAECKLLGQVTEDINICGVLRSDIINLDAIDIVSQRVTGCRLISGG